MSDPEKPEVPASPWRDPAALSSEYHRARKQLMLWSAILFIWELVGIDLEKAKEAGGNAGAVIGAIKSPQAIPWALLILVAYFTFKLRIEWRQCNEARRKVPAARQDYYLACIVAVAACLLYFGQEFSRVQLADAVQGSARTSLVVSGVGFGIGIGMAANELHKRFFLGKRRLFGWVFPITVTILTVIRTFPLRHSLTWKFVLLGCVIGLSIIGVLNLLVPNTRSVTLNRLPKN